jgi:lon-related putative ATP-dependent protease
MARHESLPATSLFRRCDPDLLDFATTAELEPLEDILGQDRAIEAIRFGVGMKAPGYNLFALGPPGLGKHTLVRTYLDRQARQRPPADDWCYVHRFDQSTHPRAIRLPPGKGQAFVDDMSRFVEEMRQVLQAAFESKEYHAQQQVIDDRFASQQDQVFDAIKERAREHDIALIKTPGGIVMAPTQQGDVVGPARFQSLPEDERRVFEDHLQRLQNELEQSMLEMPRWERSRRQALLELQRHTARSAIAALLAQIRRRYQGLEGVQSYLTDLEEDIVRRASNLVQVTSDDGPERSTPEHLFELSLSKSRMEPDPFQRYEVNLLVDNGQTDGAPVVYENYPTLENLIGRIDHQSHLGALTTDFTLIRPGALHRANGGYLVLDVRKVLMQPLAWEQLKRALRAQEIRIESPSQILGLVSTVSLEPEAIPLDVKVVLIGERMLYYLLHELDPDFEDLFKVPVDFDERVDRSGPCSHGFARYIATLVNQHELLPFDRTGVARVIEHAARLAHDSEKLSTHLEDISDLLRESDHVARHDGDRIVLRQHVDEAIAAGERRVSRVRDLLLEETHRGTFLIDTSGQVSGQINGLSVIQMGGHHFGRPQRITATVRVGNGEVLDIERETELGGPIHTKGVMILAGLLGSRFALDTPLALSARIVFEQSYGGVDGDSASLAETCALLSALAQSPIDQRFAVTGSINQRGDVQPIGGVNEKIEGFFDTCQKEGLTGDQGVIIPRANVKNLMLHHRVVDAVHRGRFHVYPVSHLEQAVTLLTGLDSGQRRPDGRFPPHSVFGRVEARLEAFANIARTFRNGPSTPSR